MIFDPATTVSNAGGELVDRRAFDGNVVPANRLSQQALNVLRLIPEPNVANAPANGTLNNFVASGSEKYDKDSFDIRIDAKYSDRLNMFGLPTASPTSGSTGRRPSGAGGGPGNCYLRRPVEGPPTRASLTDSITRGMTGS